MPPQSLASDAEPESDAGAVPEHAYYCFSVLSSLLHHKPIPAAPFTSSHSYPLFVTWNTVSRTTGSTRLRGCIGNFEPQPLEEGLRDYAEISAFKDHRFDAIALKELPRLECGVSLLMDFEICDDYQDWDLETHGIYVQLINPSLSSSVTSAPFSSTPNSTATSLSPSPAPTPALSTPSRPSYRSMSAVPAFPLPPSLARTRKALLTATYLPHVATDQGWTKTEAVDSCIRKAGYAGRITAEIRAGMRVVRYRSSKVEVRYKEWEEWTQGT